MGFFKKLPGGEAAKPQKGEGDALARAAHHYRQGLALAEKGDPVGAVREFERALALGEQNPRLLLDLGDAYTEAIPNAGGKEQQRYAQGGIDCYEKFLALDRPDLMRPYGFYVHLGVCYAVKSMYTRSLRDADEAEVAFDQAERINPGDAQIRDKRELLARCRVKYSYS